MDTDEFKPGGNLGMRRQPIWGKLEKLVAQFLRNHGISLGGVGVIRTTQNLPTPR